MSWFFYGSPILILCTLRLVAATTLTSLHFATTAIITALLCWLGFVQPSHLPVPELCMIPVSCFLEVIFDKVLNLSIKPHSRPEVCLNAINAAQCIDLIPEMVPFVETALQISANKRKVREPTTFEHHKLSQNSLPCSVNNVIDKPIVDANCNNDATKLHFHNQNHFLNNPGHVSKPCYIKRQQNHHLGPNCKSFYISPLMRDVLSSTNNHRLKSLDCNNHRTSNSSVLVLLNMKFPKDYSLPSKERLEKKFTVVGPLDHTRTKIFFYTGVGQIVFLHQADALVAFNYVTRKRIFGKANVRF